jgi:hypothetical protein
MFISTNNRFATLLGMGVAGVLTGVTGTIRAQPRGQTPEEIQAQAFVQPEPSGPAASAPAMAPPGYPTPPASATADAERGYGQDGYGQDSYGQEDYGQDSDEVPLIPPNAEGAPYASEDGQYCYVGGHPVDTRVVPGPPWDETPGQHMRSYPPVDMRLFAFRDGCYYFTGDPRDFGYAGQTYGYYGAHPVLDAYGGGWCFMMGGHTHSWAPWSPYFTVVGPWYYWRGAYDPFFWAYWPYYSLYYRSYYPHYYGGGRFYRGGGYRVAPPIHMSPRQAGGRSSAPSRFAPPVRGAAPTQMYRSSPVTAPSHPYPGNSAPRPSFTPPVRSFGPSQGGGGFGTHGGSVRGGRR